MSKSNYDEVFYSENIEGSLNSAHYFVDHLFEIFQPKSVVDVGCGRGTWLKAFSESGVPNLVGYDGAWNTQEKMIDQAIKFKVIDLNEPLEEIPERFDLAVTLEVAEHIQNKSSDMFVKTLSELSDVIVFGAAYQDQGGTAHINEQLHSYWADKFLSQGYQVFDFFRPTMWGNPNIEFWYQQNTFLYVRNESFLIQKLETAGYKPLKNLAFMNCINPSLFEIWVQRAKHPLRSNIKSVILKLLPKKLINFLKKNKKTQK